MQEQEHQLKLLEFRDTNPVSMELRSLLMDMLESMCEEAADRIIDQIIECISYAVSRTEDPGDDYQIPYFKINRNRDGSIRVTMDLTLPKDYKAIWNYW
ncbi:MAG: hypothetical protein RBR71_11395 [Gudongella sp.]|nr:hypothetical protein [Gudongella sp.]